MKIKILHRNASEPVLYTQEEFQQAMGVIFLSRLQFENPDTLFHVRKKSEKLARKGYLEPRQKWLGSYYSKEIASGFMPDVTIAWIDERINYGVISNRTIARHAYIGEYTGIIYKQRYFKKIKNDYCFEYTFVTGTTHSPYLINAERHGNHTRFINHSDQPNLETSAVFSNGLMHIILYAIKEIPPGTQLCYDYGDDYWKKRAKPLLF
jgi:hypothetical protein